jgi:hypothetical protein
MVTRDYPHSVGRPCLARTLDAPQIGQSCTMSTKTSIPLMMVVRWSRLNGRLA